MTGRVVDMFGGGARPRRDVPLRRGCLQCRGELWLLDGDRRLVPCPQCLPDTRDRWAAGRYDPQ
jgi:hypothetical protein